MKRQFTILISFVLMFFLLPISASADMWDEAYETGFEEGYSLGWADAECAMEYEGRDLRPNSSYSNTSKELDEAYDDGYEWGYEKGYEQGKSDALAQDISPQISKARKETFWLTLGFAFFFVKPMFEVFADALSTSKIKHAAAKPIHNTSTEIHTHQIHNDQFEGQCLKFIDYRNSVLILIFNPGGEYHYRDVPQHVYAGLIASASKEQYFHNNIKGKYPTF